MGSDRSSASTLSDTEPVSLRQKDSVSTTLAAAGQRAIDRIAADASTEYLVAAGDTLSDIAASLLHDRGAWLDIYRANRSVITNPDHLRVGVRLRIPSQAEIEGGPGEKTAAVLEANDDEKPLPPRHKSGGHGGGAGDVRIEEARGLLARHGDLIHQRAAQLGIEPAVAVAIVLVESGGAGIQDGRVVIRFEPRIFRRLSGHAVGSTHRNQDAEYAALARASRIDADAAYRSISMGAGQVMGFNAESLHFRSARAMLETFKNDEHAQVATMLQFIANNPVLVHAAQQHRWTTFARTYNGPKQHGYDRKLERAYAAATAAMTELVAERDAGVDSSDTAPTG